MNDPIATSSHDQAANGQAQKSNLDVDLGEINIPIRSEEEQKKIDETSEAIRLWTQSHLVKVEATRKSATKADAPTRKMIRDQVQAIWNKINGFKSHEEASYRLAAWMALLVHFFRSADPEDFAQANDHLDWMVKRGHLIEVNPEEEKPSLRAWKRGFRVPEQACFGEKELTETQKELGGFVTKTISKTVNRRKDRAKDLQAKFSTGSAEAFKEGFKGTAFLHVPPMITAKSDGKVISLQGGFMLADFAGDEIFPIEGIGTFEDSLAQAKEEKIFVKADSLNRNFAPSWKKLESSGFSESQAKCLRLSWQLLKRAKDHLEKKKEFQEEILAFSKKATISEEAFFLKRQDGTALVNFEGVWEIWESVEGRNEKTDTIYNIFLLVKRLEGKIEIVSCPNHLGVFFFDCMETYDEGEKFQGVPQPLQAILQAQFGACQTKALIN